MRFAVLATVLIAWVSTAAQAADDREPRVLMRDAATEQADKMPPGDELASEPAIVAKVPVERSTTHDRERAAQAASAEAHLAAVAAARRADERFGNEAPAPVVSVARAAVTGSSAADCAQHGAASVARERAASAGSSHGRGPASIGRSRP